MTVPATTTTGVGWSARAGAWLAIGSSPAALVLGAGIAHRHGGAAAALPLLAGALVMGALLTAQGKLGLAEPLGEAATLSELAPRYLRRSSHVALNAILGVAMIGWFGFNVGLGGAAAAALLDLPGWAGPLLLGVPIVALSFGGMGRWNALAIATTSSALVLVGVVALRLAAPQTPVTVAPGPLSLAVPDVAALVGYASVFSVRAPDFSVGLRSGRDLLVCVGLLVVPTLLVLLAGAGLYLGTGSVDLVGTLAARDGLPVGNLLVALSVIAPAFTTTYSGSLSLRSVTRLSERAAVLTVAIPGLALAVLRFDRQLVGWLTVLAALLPPLVVPMALEGARRRRGRAPRLVPLWTFAPASAVAVALTAAHVPVAPLVGLALAGAATAWWTRRRRPPAGRSPDRP